MCRLKPRKEACVHLASACLDQALAGKEVQVVHAQVTLFVWYMYVHM